MSEYVLTVERAFRSAPFRIEYHTYAPGAVPPGVWQMLHQSNGAIITTGASPAGCVANLIAKAQQMQGIISSLPHQGQASDA